MAEFDGIVVLLSKGQQVVLVPIQTDSGRTHTLFTKMSEETREELGHNVSTVPVDILDRLHGACPGGKGKHRALASGNGRQTTGHHLLPRVVVLGDEVTELALGFTSTQEQTLLRQLSQPTTAIQECPGEIFVPVIVQEAHLLRCSAGELPCDGGGALVAPAGSLTVRTPVCGTQVTDAAVQAVLLLGSLVADAPPQVCHTHCRQSAQLLQKQPDLALGMGLHKVALQEKRADVLAGFLEKPRVAWVHGIQLGAMFGGLVQQCTDSTHRGIGFELQQDPAHPPSKQRAHILAAAEQVATSLAGDSFAVARYPGHLHLPPFALGVVPNVATGVCRLGSGLTAASAHSLQYTHEHAHTCRHTHTHCTYPATAWPTCAGASLGTSIPASAPASPPLPSNNSRWWCCWLRWWCSRLASNSLFYRSSRGGIGVILTRVIRRRGYRSRRPRWWREGTRLRRLQQFDRPTQAADDLGKDVGVSLCTPAEDLRQLRQVVLDSGNIIHACLENRKVQYKREERQVGLD